MAFHNVRLPVSVELGSRGGPVFKTSIVTLSSGAESRNQDWQKFRIRRDVGYPIRTRAEMADVQEHFIARRGNFHTFPFRDWSDYTVTDESVGTGDGTTAAFQLIKTYEASGPDPYVRNITKPDADTVVIKVDGTTKTVTTHYTLDALTGIVTFTSGNIPTAGQAVTWSGQFFVPVRYNVGDEMLGLIAQFDDGMVVDGLEVIEVRE